MVLSLKDSDVTLTCLEMLRDACIKAWRIDPDTNLTRAASQILPRLLFQVCAHKMATESNTTLMYGIAKKNIAGIEISPTKLSFYCATAV